MQFLVQFNLNIAMLKGSASDWNLMWFLGIAFVMTQQCTPSLIVIESEETFVCQDTEPIEDLRVRHRPLRVW